MPKRKKSLVKERIRTVSQKNDNLKSQVATYTSSLDCLRPEDKLQVIALAEKTREREYNQVSWRQQKKMEKLIERKRCLSVDNSTIDLSGEWLKKWVVNISKHKVAKDETAVLSKGLNFAVSPENIPTDEYIVATEQACKFLPDDESHQLRAKVAGLHHSAKPPQSNLSKRERQALGNLAKNRDITILPADKGKATVIMDTAEYESKVKEMLGDRRIYEVLQSDPTPKYKNNDLISKLSQVKAGRENNRTGL